MGTWRGAVGQEADFGSGGGDDLRTPRAADAHGGGVDGTALRTRRELSVLEAHHLGANFREFDLQLVQPGWGDFQHGKAIFVVVLVAPGAPVRAPADRAIAGPVRGVGRRMAGRHLARGQLFIISDQNVKTNGGNWHYRLPSRSRVPLAPASRRLIISRQRGVDFSLRLRSRIWLRGLAGPLVEFTLPDGMVVLTTRAGRKRESPCVGSD